MVVTGCALPFRVDIRDEARDERVQFSTGAFRQVIAGGAYVEVVVNHVWKEHLASTVHGLTLWETFAGLYFSARLPETPYATSIYDAVVAGTIQHVCALSLGTETEQHEDVVMVRTASLYAVNLLLSAPPHCPEAWVSWGGPPADKRIAKETAAAEQRHLWALKEPA